MVSDSKNISMALGGAALAALGVAAYYKFCKTGSGVDYTDIHSVSRDELAALLDEIVQNQEEMKTLMATLQSEIIEKDLSFLDVCEMVETRSSKSPLEKYGLSVQNFSSLLAGHNSDPVIRKKIMRLTSSGVDPMGKSTAGEVNIDNLVPKHSVESIIDIHSYMLQRLKDTIQNLNIRKKTNPRLATVAAQAYVGKLVQIQYGLSCEQLEGLACHFHSGLSQDERFFEIGTELRQALTKLTDMCTEGSATA